MIRIRPVPLRGSIVSLGEIAAATAERPRPGLVAGGVLRRLFADRSGVSAVLLGVSLTVILGFAGLGTEIGLWYFTKRAMQGAADGAAYSAAMANAAGEPSSAFIEEAKSIAARDGFTDDVNGVTVTVNNPPKSGSFTTNSKAIEVIIAQPATPMISELFLASAPTIRARAVATAQGDGCVLALDQGTVTDVTTVGSTTVNAPKCDIYVDSSSTTAFTLTGNATVNTNAAYISGNYTTTSGASLTTTQGTYTGVPPTPDPYLDVQIPSYSGCDQNNYSLSGGLSQTFTPGASGVMVFCNGLSLTGGASITLNPGVYIIDRGSFSIQGGTTISGSGVTIVLTSSTASNYATAAIAGGANVNLSAPTISSPPPANSVAGLAFFQDRNAPSAGTSDNFTGGATQNITGAIYFPNQNVKYAGGTSTGGSTCTQLVAFTINFVGNANFETNCAGKGVRSIGHAPITVVE